MSAIAALLRIIFAESQLPWRFCHDPGWPLQLPGDEDPRLQKCVRCGRRFLPLVEFRYDRAEGE